MKELEDFEKNIGDPDSDVRYMAVTYLLSAESLTRLKECKDVSVQKKIVKKFLLIMADETSKIRNLTKNIASLLEIVDKSVLMFAMENIVSAFSIGKKIFSETLPELQKPLSSDVVEQYLDEPVNEIMHKEAANALREVWKKLDGRLRVTQDLIVWFLDHSIVFLEKCYPKLTTSAQCGSIEVYYDFVRNHAESIVLSPDALKFVQIIKSQALSSHNKRIQHYSVKIIGELFTFARGKLSSTISTQAIELCKSLNKNQPGLTNAYLVIGELCSRQCVEAQLLSKNLYEKFLKLTEKPEMLHLKLSCLAEILKSCPTIMSSRESFDAIEQMLLKSMNVNPDRMETSNAMELDEDSEEEIGEFEEFEVSTDLSAVNDQTSLEVVKSAGRIILELSKIKSLTGDSRIYGKLYNFLIYKMRELEEVPCSFLSAFESLISASLCESSHVQKIRQFEIIQANLSQLMKKVFSSVKPNSTISANNGVLSLTHCVFQLPADLLRNHVAGAISILQKIKCSSACVFLKEGSNPIYSLLHNILDHAPCEELYENYLKIVQNWGNLVRSFTTVDSCQEIFLLLQKTVKFYSQDPTELTNVVSPILDASIKLLNHPCHSKLSIDACMAYISLTLSGYAGYPSWTRHLNDFIMLIQSKCQDSLYSESCAKAVCELSPVIDNCKTHVAKLISSFLENLGSKSHELISSSAFHALALVIGKCPEVFSQMKLHNRTIFSKILALAEYRQGNYMNKIVEFYFNTLEQFTNEEMKDIVKEFSPVILDVLTNDLLSEELSIEMSKLFRKLVHYKLITVSDVMNYYMRYILEVSPENDNSLLRSAMVSDEVYSPLTSSMNLDFGDDVGGSKSYKKDSALFDKHRNAARATAIFLFSAVNDQLLSFNDVRQHFPLFSSDSQSFTNSDILSPPSSSKKARINCDQSQVQSETFKILFFNEYNKLAILNVDEQATCWLMKNLGNSSNFIAEAASLTLGHVWSVDVQKMKTAILSSALPLPKEEIFYLAYSVKLALATWVAVRNDLKLPPEIAKHLWSHHLQLYKSQHSERSIREEIGSIHCHLLLLNFNDLASEFAILMNNLNDVHISGLCCYILYTALLTFKPSQIAFFNEFFNIAIQNSISADLDVRTYAAVCLKRCFLHISDEEQQKVVNYTSFTSQLSVLIDACICLESHKQVTTAGDKHKVVVHLSLHPRKLCLELVADAMDVHHKNMMYLPSQFTGANNMIIIKLLTIMEEGLDDDQFLMTTYMKLLPHITFIHPKFVALELGKKWFSRITQELNAPFEEESNSKSSNSAGKITSIENIPVNKDSCQLKKVKFSVTDSMHSMYRCLVMCRRALKKRGLDVNTVNYLSVNFDAILNDSNHVEQLMNALKSYY